jgi:hypothetical protein
MNSGNINSTPLNVPVNLYECVDGKYYPVEYNGKRIEYRLLDVLQESHPAIIRHQEAVREAMRTGADWKALKLQSAAMTISATFPGQRKNVLSYVGKYNELIALDIDAKDNTGLQVQFDDLIKELAKVQVIAYAGRSISGTGYFCIVRLTLDPANFQGHFKQLRQDFESAGLIIDAKCSDIGRLRYVSYDKEGYFNHAATRYTKLYSEATAPQAPREALPARYSAQVTSDRDRTEQRVRALIEAIERSRTDITDTYAAWFGIAGSIASEYGEAGRSYFHRVSQFHPEYSATATDIQYTKVMRAGYHRFKIDTLFFHAKRCGVTANASTIVQR